MPARPHIVAVPDFDGPINRPLSADDVIALALSMIRGRVFGKRSTEVTFLRLALEKSGFTIVRRKAEAT